MLSACRILEADPLRLRATGAGISVIDTVSEQQAQTLDLFVSRNAIKDLKRIGQFRFLRRLMISYNQLTYIEDLFPLSRLTSLQYLNIEGNPLCALPLLRFHIAKLLPNLKILNREQVDFSVMAERAEALVSCESAILRAIVDEEDIATALRKRRCTIMPCEGHNLVKRCHKIRLSGEGLPLRDYFEMLRQLMGKKREDLKKAAREARIKCTFVELRGGCIPTSWNLEDVGVLKGDAESLTENAHAVLKSRAQFRQSVLSCGFGRDGKIGHDLSSMMDSMTSRSEFSMDDLRTNRSRSGRSSRSETSVVSAGGRRKVRRAREAAGSETSDTSTGGRRKLSRGKGTAGAPVEPLRKSSPNGRTVDSVVPPDEEPNTANEDIMECASESDPLTTRVDSDVEQVSESPIDSVKRRRGDSGAPETDDGEVKPGDSTETEATTGANTSALDVDSPRDLSTIGNVLDVEATTPITRPISNVMDDVRAATKRHRETRRKELMRNGNPLTGRSIGYVRREESFITNVRIT